VAYALRDDRQGKTGKDENMHDSGAQGLDSIAEHTRLHTVHKTPSAALLDSRASH